ncbi:MBL fold metallo-hydrolase [Sporosarcina sp. BI001-red]|uniref:MBL fold metallo-hydrolase n=1 Tax=Sporosarcina sp. BI001-red TaxID=2282866 RepID=UPI000E21CB39|nr:MBL fold metallo-hydrolase [Sporosarcina sp. BI001-red]REB06115.1 MBL fold metallo-hydrolase [Sporosarcina sp. BI001-red]
MNRKRYRNLDPTARPATFSELVRWQKERFRKQKDMSFTIGQAPDKQLTLLHTNQDELTITWIGHSTFLIQLAGLTIVTDPVWASRMGFGRRLEEPGLTLEEIPPVDIILLSHSHYDHLDVPSLKKLKGTPAILVPEGLGRKVRKLMMENRVYELPWWGQVRIGSVEFHFVPAQHWTKRTLTDTNTSHWGGWIIQRHMEPSTEALQPESIYFAGDSGYFKGFCEIGKKFSHITYALMPIGAYEPEWFMGTQHMTPEEAIQAFVDVSADVFIPMHYGAFYLADDTTEEALNRLLTEWAQRELEDSDLKVLKHGETLSFVHSTKNRN